MQILILEDNLDRVVHFYANLPKDAQIAHVSSAAECKQHLYYAKWDILFLDHDLDGKIMLPSGPGTGYEVAEWLAENPDYQPPVIVVHSFNPSGSENICKLLPTAVARPGAWSDPAFLSYIITRARRQ